MQLVGLRYTEPDMTISYPGFLYLLMKLESMISKGGMMLDNRGGKACKMEFYLLRIQPDIISQYTYYFIFPLFQLFIVFIPFFQINFKYMIWWEWDP